MKNNLIKGIDLVFLYVKDLEESIKFYQEKLGLELIYSSAVWAEFFDGSKTKFSLWKKDDFSPSEGNIFLAVDDINIAEEELKKENVSIVFGPEKYFYGYVMEIKDPSGNIIGIYQRTDRE